MEKPTIKDLRDQECEIIAKREHHKKQVKALTKDLYNTKQKIKYIKKTENKVPCGILFEMFGKRRHELTAEELRQYNAFMQKRRREDAKKLVDTNKKLD